MKNVTVTIKAQGAVIADHVSTYQADTLPKAVGLAIMGAHENYTSQYVDPIILIDDIQLTKSMVNLIKGNYWTLQENFSKIRENLLPIYALQSEEEKVAYIRRVDVNGYFKTTKTFTNEQLASIAKEQLKKTQFALSIDRFQAKAAVWTEDQLKLKAQYTEVRKLERESKKLTSK
jgi:hypothetical protein